jgi:DNA-binding NtrC family response regulator
MLGNKILLVDDEESILKSFGMNFRQAGYNVTTSSSGEEAVAKIQEHHFDIVVTDLSMPGLNGIAVLVESKKHNPDIGAIILTGYGDTSLAIEALQFVADDYVLKPCDIDELLLRIARILKNKEAFQKVAFYETILPVCMYCKSIRVDKNAVRAVSGSEKWVRIGEYLHNINGTDVSHTICPQCKDRAVKDKVLNDQIKA